MEFAKTVRRLILPLAERLKVHRLQATIPVDEPWGERWTKFLGMEREATLRKFDPFGGDVHVYVRFIDVGQEDN
jgi:hypothetical protein